MPKLLHLGTVASEDVIGGTAKLVLKQGAIYQSLEACSVALDRLRQQEYVPVASTRDSTYIFLRLMI